MNDNDKSIDLFKGNGDPNFPGFSRTVALTIELQGVTKGPIAVKVDKKAKAKAQRLYVQHKGKMQMQAAEHKDAEVTKPVQRRIICEDTYNYFITTTPIIKKKSRYLPHEEQYLKSYAHGWRKNLEYYLGEIAEGKLFTYEIL